MALISLLLIMALERVVTKTRYWRSETYLDKYFELISSKDWFAGSKSVWHIFFVTAVPAILMLTIQVNVENALLELFVGCAVLMVGTGCPNVRSSFKGYLQAANRGDLEACDLYAQQLNYTPGTGRTFGQHVVWINYSHYMAVALWFIALGAAGVVLYVSVRYVALRLTEEEHELAPKAFMVLHVLDWIPVRITSLGYLLVGNFSNSVGVWIRLVGNSKVSAPDFIGQTAKAAEVIEPDQDDCTEEPCTMLKLAKRNAMLMLVVVAILTLGGVIS